MRILLANDDGIDAEGLKLLASKLVKYGEVLIVAPDRPRSASSHRIILEPMTLEKVDYDFQIEAYKTSGTPADCVRIATSVLGKFDICFSGINNGLNLGTDIVYSGTVAAAREAFIEGYPSVAVSVDSNDFTKAEADLDNLLQYIFDKNLYSRNYVLNINYPVKGVEVKGYAFSKMGKKRFKTEFELDNGVCIDVGAKIKYDTDSETDVVCADKGYVSFTPLDIDMTCYSELENLKKR